MPRFNFNEIALSGKADVSKIQENFTKIEENGLASSDIVDNLISTDTDKALSAYQGKVLKRLADNLAENKANSNDVYTKTEEDNKLTNYKLKSDFAVLTGTVNFSDSSKVNPLGEYQINYPSGFTVNNCVVISCMIDDDDMYYSTPHSYNSKEQYVILYTNKIALCDKYAYAQQFTHVKYKIVLMKIS